MKTFLSLLALLWNSALKWQNAAKIVEEEDWENTFSSTNSSKDHLNAEFQRIACRDKKASMINAKKERKTIE